MDPDAPSTELPGSAPRAWVLVGPTGAGKTDVAHQIALRRRARILSADSMLVYAGMDIGTAKPTPDSRREVPYGGIDVVRAGEVFSVAAWLQSAREFVSSATADGTEIIVAGGTGLYVRCLLEGLGDVAPPDGPLRAHWFPHVAEHGVEALAREVAVRAPAAFAQMSAPDRANARRLVRVLEQDAAGLERGEEWRVNRPTAVILGLRHQRDALRSRIRARAEHMFSAGLLEEVDGLVASGHLSRTAAQAIGYAEALATNAGKISVEEAVARTVTRTWRLARKQMTWFRHQARVTWLDVEPDEELDSVVNRVILAWRETGPAVLGGLIDD